jgi:hypothetical protein
LLTRAEALSGGLPPHFEGGGGIARTLIVQTVSRAVNEVENGHGGGAQQAERLGGMNFPGDWEEKGIGTY